uniref:Uncharacterized protein n=1 Tax=Chromera velia CCMP2878 TaxID=1169474 RepID=A0A0G4HXF9_9ALVE|eukprot:Cvel_1486.t1-p1 / transcript=Cvel_1486.t1 / gene=Cvel_1486 / organism=Chromera_velia_CCMP2878 / gene_product=Putative ankyrin repeat protein RF_0381, putative / transcript_product=Putative ankyrin repeat protein RF_0381, putative / location=Cvel_scaffold52:40965-42302(-) / protein_length=446 / sequence_SO=supercontig / SO=protein_coding / is_pseudo=false
MDEHPGTSTIVVDSENLPAVPCPVEEELDSLEASLLSVLEGIRKKKEVIAKIKARARRESGQSIVDNNRPPASPPVLPQEAAALERLRQLVDEVRKRYHVELDQIISWNYSMDLSPLFDLDICNVIRSFESVSAETLRSGLDTFLDSGKKDDLSLYLKVGAHMDGIVDNETVLLRCVDRGNLEAVEMLVGAGAGLEVGEKERDTALLRACRRGLPDIARFLVSKGASVKAENHLASKAIHLAAGSGSVHLVKFILANGGDLHAQNADGRTALHIAANKGRWSVTELLLDRGAKVNAPDFELTTPLFETVTPNADPPHHNDHRNVAELLLSRGADVNARDQDQWTVLHRAAFLGVPNVAALVLDHGIDLHALDQEGGTALHCAVLMPPNSEDFGIVPEKKVEILQMLLDRGIDMGQPDINGQTARDLAEKALPTNSPIRQFFLGLDG